jgi:hypothetical protein
VIGLVFWIAVLAAFAYPRLRSERATLLLNVRTAEPLSVSGAVTYGGQAVSGGTVQLTLMDALEPKHLGSATLTVGAGGDFFTDPAKPLATGVANRRLKLQASFFGQTVAADPKERKPLVGSETLYVNFTPMFGPTARWVVGGLSVPLLLLIFLFTGPLTRAKARLLFMVTYGFALFSCAIPLAVTFWISRNPYLLEVMEHAPVGLLKGIGQGMSNPQWLVNIGGAVLPRRPLVETSAAAQEPAAGEPGTVSPASPASPALTLAAEAHSPVAASDGYSPVKGGLTIPLFVILLATLGGGINMTRKVPEIQRDYDCVAITLEAAMKAPVAVFSDAGEQVRDADATSVRRDLIETYMYFISAPFLAIAVYYFLQVIATSVAEPVLVVIAFATGLMSNTVVGSIIAFADVTLRKAQGSPGAAGAQAAMPAAAASPSQP